MLLGFLVRDDADWVDWKRRIADVRGKAIVRVHEKAPPGGGERKEREGAVDEVETFDDETEEEDGDGDGDGDTATEVGG